MKSEHSLSDVFQGKYGATSDWGGHSGPGSSPAYMTDYVGFLERFAHMNRIASIADVGCGDWQFSRFVNFQGASYTGYDVVPGLIERNRRLFGGPSVRFEPMPEAVGDLPGGDLLIVKDVLQHLPNAVVLEMLRALLPKFRFALLTNSFVKLNTPVNVDIRAGEFRCLDLQAPPFGVEGAYVLEFATPAWEFLRTLLVIRGV